MDESEPPPIPSKKVKLGGASTSSDVAMEDTPAESLAVVRAKEDVIIADDDTATPSHLQKDSYEMLQSIDKEAACGITEFVSPDLQGFTGFLKKRYTDFLVNEILPSGQVIHLDNLKAPKPAKKQELSHGGETISSPSQKPDATQGAAKEDVSSIQQGLDLDASFETPNGDKESQPATPQNKLGENVEPYTVSSDSSGIAQTVAPPSNVRAQDVSSPDLSVPGPSKDEPKMLAPHLRVPPPKAYVPLSMQDLDGSKPTTKLEPSSRKKETVLIRQTAGGWVEVDEAKEKKLKEQKSVEDSAAGRRNQNDDSEKPVKEEPKIEEREAMGPPPLPSTETQWQAFGPPTPDFQLSSEDRSIMVNYFGAETTDAIIKLYDRIVNSPHRKSKDYGLVRSGKIDRETRSKLHQDIRRIFSSRLETVTDPDGGIVITAMTETPTFHARTPMNHGRGAGRDRGRGNDRRGNDRGQRSNQWGKPGWKELGGDYLHFSLYKENKDTMESISWLAKELKMRPSAFQFAGTKDRRGVTVQRVSIYHVFVDRLVAAGRSLRQAKIGNFEYQPHQLQLGELSGNEFVITLRDCAFRYQVPVDTKTMVEEVQSVVGTAIMNLVERGFINYYGLQRFGSFSTGTHDIGIKMLRGDFQGAVDGILHFSPVALAAAQDPMNDKNNVSQDDKARAWAIHDFKSTGRPQSALRTLPRKFSAESTIIRHLSGKNSSNDYQGAMQTVQRNLCMMYVHAYQSLVWNMAASERWKRFGSQVVEGDLVLIDEHAIKDDTTNSGEDVDVDGEAIVHPTEDDRAADPEDQFTRARALTKEEVESGRYNIFDIVLPTPGFDILYPANDMLKFYEEFMASERGGALDPHDMRRKWRTISLSGSYRKVLAKPLNDMTYDVKLYKNEDEQFVETDLDRMNKAKEQQVNTQHSRSAPLPQEDKALSDTKDNGGEANGHLELSSSNAETKSEISDNEPGGLSLSGGPYRDYKVAVVLKMQLGTSQYATMALRELMKLGGVKTYKPDFGGGR
ncbi:tRNA pseudouridine13 synthase, partial [Lecanoromycetidae sp. Uapishka_2]